MNKKRWADVVFATVLLALAVAAVLVSSQWNLRSRLFVQVVAIPMALLLVVQVILSVRRPENAEESSRMDSTIGGDLEPVVVLRRGLEFVLWLAAFLTATWLFGIMWGGIPVLALYMLFGLGEKLLPTVLMAAAIALVMLALREVMSVSMPTGEVFRWIS